MAAFNLIDEPWIPVVSDGEPGMVSIWTALSEAHALQGLAGDPLETVAVFRQVLLPFAIHALGPLLSDDDWIDRWEAETFDVEVLKRYCDEHRMEFDLFGSEMPFGQVADLRTGKDETKPTSVLLPHLASGNNVPLFSCRTDVEAPALTPAEAARALLSCLCWDTAAIKSGAADDPQVKAGKTTGNPTGPAGQLGVVLLLGKTLKDTILLNTVVQPQGLSGGDRPAWTTGRRTSQWKDGLAPAGVLDLLTWQARRIRLIPDRGEGVSPTVRRVVLCAGDRLQVTNDESLEWFTAWQRVEKPAAGAPKQRPVRHDPGRSAWRGMSGLLAIQKAGQEHERFTCPTTLTQLGTLRADRVVPDDYPLNVLTVGVRYGNQSAVIEDVMTDLIPLPIAALERNHPARSFVLAVADQAKEVHRALDSLENDLRAAAGSDKLPWDRGQHPGEAFIHGVEKVVRRLLAAVQEQPARAAEAETSWRRAAHRTALTVAEPMLDSATSAMFLGREPGKQFAPRTSTAESRFRATLRKHLGSAVDGEPEEDKEA